MFLMFFSAFYNLASTFDLSRTEINLLSILMKMVAKKVLVIKQLF